jgi:TFIIF-interacting CTD phosphatase-like protein
MLQPECALPILSWYEDPKDRALFELIPLLIELSKVDDVRDAIPNFVRSNIVDFNQALKVCNIL